MKKISRIAVNSASGYGPSTEAYEDRLTISEGGIPFEVKLDHSAYNPEQIVKETEATLVMEGLILSEEEIRMLTEYTEGKVSGDDLKKSIFASVAPADRGESTEAG